MTNIDPYSDPTTGLLLNRIGAKTEVALDAGEAELTWLALANRAAVAHLDSFDLKHLTELHKHVFGKVYDWAGQIRTVHIAKGETRFAAPEKIVYGAQKLFDSLRAESVLKGTDAERFSQRAGHYLGELNFLHPFREGNGRTQRLFIDQMALGAGYKIGWQNVSPVQMRDASAHAIHSDASGLVEIIYSNLSVIPSVGAELKARAPEIERVKPAPGLAL